MNRAVAQKSRSEPNHWFGESLYTYCYKTNKQTHTHAPFSKQNPWQVTTNSRASCKWGALQKHIHSHTYMVHTHAHTHINTFTHTNIHSHIHTVHTYSTSVDMANTILFASDGSASITQHGESWLVTHCKRCLPKTGYPGPETFTVPLLVRGGYSTSSTSKPSLRFKDPQQAPQCISAATPSFFHVHIVIYDVALWCYSSHCLLQTNLTIFFFLVKVKSWFCSYWQESVSILLFSWSEAFNRAEITWEYLKNQSNCPPRLNFLLNSLAKVSVGGSVPVTLQSIGLHISLLTQIQMCASVVPCHQTHRNDKEEKKA